eukprot:TRINITY_DN931_c0_g1_i1.p1 TRINITY_DN931_c0_g1~~TRINITY_DN931_c0_g1_i1.p1  ORF type:complete len:1044 (+),score=194.98 TRINITY_DN931_c0_g1_i1:44-3133(+)
MPSEEEDGGGTFWSTFGGPERGAPELSPLEKLLENPNCSVEEILDQEEVIQEFKYGNAALVARLCKPDGMRTLFEFITTEPPTGARQARCFRYPFVAVELMTCGAGQFLKVLSSPENPELSDALWGFLETTPADEVNPVLAGYFARTVGALLANWRSAGAELAKHQMDLFVEQLRQRFVDTLFDRFVERLHLRSIADLFAGLVCAEQQEHMVFSVEGLADKLVTRLADEHSETGAEENVAVITIGMLSQRDKIFFSEDLLQQLTSTRVVNVLVDQIFSDRPVAVAAASSILASVVFHAYVAPEGGEAETSPRRGATMIEDVASHLPRIRSYLDKALSKCSQTPRSPSTSSTNLVGSTTLEVVNLFTMLVRTGSSLVLEAMLREQLLLKCVELFFRHPWSTLLHNAVTALIGEVMSGGAGMKLVLNLLCDGGLLERIVAEYKAEREIKTSRTKPRGPRVGYMGHLHSLCCDLRDYGCRASEVSSALQAQPGWTDIVVVGLDEALRVLSEQLGGGVPSADRGLASTGGSMSERGSSDQGLDLGSITRSDLDSDFQLMNIKGWDEDDIGWQHDGSSGDSDSPERGSRDESSDDRGDSESPPIIPVLEDKIDQEFFSHASLERPSAPSPGSDRDRGGEPPAPADPLTSPSPPHVPAEPLPVASHKVSDSDFLPFATDGEGCPSPKQPPSPPSPPAVAVGQADETWRADFDMWAEPPTCVGAAPPASSSLDTSPCSASADSPVPVAGGWVAAFDTMFDPETSASPASPKSPWDAQPGSPSVPSVAPAASTSAAVASELNSTLSDLRPTTELAATPFTLDSKVAVSEAALVPPATASVTSSAPAAEEPEAMAANESLFALLGTDSTTAPPPAAQASQASGDSSPSANANTCTNTAPLSTAQVLPWTAFFGDDSSGSASTTKLADPAPVLEGVGVVGSLGSEATPSDIGGAGASVSLAPGISMSDASPSAIDLTFPGSFSTESPAPAAADDRSWVADFDTLFQPSTSATTTKGGKLPSSTGTGGEASLELVWPPEN